MVAHPSRPRNNELGELGLPSPTVGRQNMNERPKLIGRRIALCGIAGGLVCGVANAQQKTRDKLKEPVYRVSAKSDANRPAPHPLDEALRMAEASLQNIQRNILDYKCVLIKREQINGKLGHFEYMYTKVRNHKELRGTVTQPFSVYMYFLKPKKVEGREVLYVEGRNRDRLTAHEKSIFIPTVNLDPNSALAMRGQRYPITDIGIENLVKKLIERGEQEKNSGNCEVNFNYKAKFNGRPCTVLDIKHPVKKPGLEFFVAQIFIDKELNIPVRYVAYDFPAKAGSPTPILEEYNYTKVKLNVGLKDIDFDTDNPDYNF
jgi:hypothetical protein